MNGPFEVQILEQQFFTTDSKYVGGTNIFFISFTYK